MNEPENRIDLQPRPKLLVALLVFFFIWIGLLLWMYFATVYPMRHPQHPLAPAAATTLAS